ncbi:hypothetical protein CK203_008742 [Vitis vinifera]|uniref:Uncharacterized protein n=1 Tax=Vitis vinifera TaxID=29760 RepID=A0A438KD86_VITVI|nr:hypothetical protein CK203_008742 [Vitis vinifera]
MRIRFSVRRVSFLLPNPTPNWEDSCESFITQLSLLQDAPLSFRFFSSSSTSPSSPNPKQCSFTVSYLINSCGLSADSALSASPKASLGNPRKARLCPHTPQKLWNHRHPTSQTPTSISNFAFG